MEEILIVVALVIVVALLFWLDKKAEKERCEAGSMYHEVLQIFNRVRWGMNSHALREIFSEKELVHKDESDDLAGIGYIDKFEGHDASVNFHFLKGDKESLVGIDFYIHHVSVNKSNSLFSKLCEKYGSPLNQDDAEGKSVLWDLDNSVLTFEVSDGQELQIRFWKKEFYITM
ncbi:MAG TPA: hypothetical protein VHT73_01580 [Thermodesulfobacteriota bacterium]|nr:hypothetical protein [Thermodesulfobacteriota bacterium]